MSRVKSHAITSPAMAVLKNIGKLALPIGFIILSLIPLTMVYKWVTRPAPIVVTSSMPYARGGGYERPVVGPCDGVKRKFYFSPEHDSNNPANPNGQCKASWEFPDGKCIYQKAAMIEVLGFGEAPTEGPFGDCEGNRGWKGPLNVEYAWAANKEGFWGYLTLTPN